MTTFVDPDHFAEALIAENGWPGLRVTPVRGPFSAELTTFEFPGVWVVRGQMTAAINQSKSSPHQTSIVFTDDGSPPLIRDGVAIAADDIVVWPSDVPCCTRVEAAHGWGCILFPTDEFSRATGFELGDRIVRVRPPPAALTRLRRLHRSLLNISLSAEHLASPQIARQFRGTLMGEIVSCLWVVDELPSAIDGSRRTRVIRRFKELLDENEHWPLPLVDIYAALGVEARTMRQYCEDCFGMGPRDYMMLHRLNHVRRDLVQGDPDGTTVAQVALRYGFIQLGRFAGRYRKVFDESPSVTLRTTKWPVLHRRSP